MSISEIKSSLPAYAKDLKLNFGSVIDSPALEREQAWGCAVASAVASRNATLTRAIVADAAEHMSDEAIEAAKGAAAVMGMNNIYYRFLHMVADDEYRSMPARLRMNIIGKPGVEKATFELWSLAVSAVNGCSDCIASHEQVVRKAGMSKQSVQAAARIAAVVHAIAGVLDAEEALS